MFIRKTDLKDAHFSGVSYVVRRIGEAVILLEIEKWCRESID